MLRIGARYGFGTQQKWLVVFQRATWRPGRQSSVRGKEKSGDDNLLGLPANPSPIGSDSGKAAIRLQKVENVLG
jgi:hypothetical protein